MPPEGPWHCSVLSTSSFSWEQPSWPSSLTLSLGALLALLLLIWGLLSELCWEIYKSILFWEQLSWLPSLSLSLSQTGRSFSPGRCHHGFVFPSSPSQPWLTTPWLCCTGDSSVPLDAQRSPSSSSPPVWYHKKTVAGPEFLFYFPAILFTSLEIGNCIT